MPTLTIGMATYDDFHGCYFTIKALRLYHQFEGEIVVVDNNPSSRHGSMLKDLCSKLDVKYVPFAEANGTTQPRNKVFEVATSDFVMCVDSHVLLNPNALKLTYEYLTIFPKSNDLYAGPMLLDGGWFYTHFDLRWRGQMWGVWATAWRTSEGSLFSVQEAEGGSAGFYKLDSVMSPANYPELNFKIPFAGHQAYLLEKGIQPAVGSTKLLYAAATEDGQVLTSLTKAKLEFDCKDLSNVRYFKTIKSRHVYESLDDCNATPFEIPAQGLGLFMCRKEAWLGFNHNFRAFGGEEGYIHEKFRKNGRKTILLPWLTWEHRFGRPDGVPYKFSMEDKVRNYVLGFQEVGLDLEPIKEHFLAEGMSLNYWNKLLANPTQIKVDYSAPTVSPNGRPLLQPQPAHVYNSEGVYDFLKKTPRDLDQHLDKIREYASECTHVTEMTKRRESSAALVFSGASEVISYQEENDGILDYIERYKPASTKWALQIGSLNATPLAINPTDLLFIDTRHNGKRLREELKFISQVKKYLILHDVASHGVVGDDGNEGLFGPLKELVASGEWFVDYFTPNQYGLIVLARRGTKVAHPKPIVPWPIGYGPGTEMFNMLKEIGVTDKPGCTCKATAEQMDRWGVDGCREPDNFNWILEQVNANAANWKWSEYLAIAAKNVLNPSSWKLAWTLDPLNIHKSLIETAINLAEEKMTCDSSCETGTCKKGCRQ